MNEEFKRLYSPSAKACRLVEVPEDRENKVQDV
jgi:hypothetical protein